MTTADPRRDALDQFASVARRCRAAAGYRDSKSFYKALGGAAFFGCTAKAFANVEKGAGLPQPRLIEKMVAALRLPMRKRLAREFSLGYLRLLLGSDEFVALAVRAFSQEEPAPMTARRDWLLSRRQAALLRRDPLCYWCFTILSNDRGRWDAEALAQVLQSPPALIRKALSLLKAAGLTPGDACRRRAVFPDDDGFVSAAAADMRKHWSGLEESVSLMEHPLFLRASEEELRQFFPLLIEALRGAEEHAALDKEADTALFAIEGRVRKLVSF